MIDCGRLVLLIVQQFMGAETTGRIFSFYHLLSI